MGIRLANDIRDLLLAGSGLAPFWLNCEEFPAERNYCQFVQLDTFYDACHVIQMLRTLPESLRDRPFTYREAVSLGLSQYAIHKLLAAGEIERIERGIYQAVGGDISDSELFRRAVKKIGEPSAVCLLSALSYYHLTDVIPDRVWLMVSAKTRTASRNIRLYRTRDPRWKIGIVAEDGYSITSVERTLVDALTNKAVLPVRIGLDALKRAVGEKQTSISNVIVMSKSLGVLHRILPYVEALL